jgi:hypothetical protein
MLHIKEFQTAGDDIQHGGRQRANFKLRDCQAFDVMGGVLSKKPGDLLTCRTRTALEITPLLLLSSISSSLIGFDRLS